jgi:photosystem II stability/assembly factor-like uncharacterized protein
LIQRKRLPVLVLAYLVLASCSARAGTVTPALPSGGPTSPASASPATPVPSSTAAASPTATETSFPPALPVVPSPTLTWINFPDTKNGWGIAVNGNGYVLRTVNGGSTWLNATPPGTGSIGLSASLTVLNTNHLWVLVPTTDFFSGTLYRTGDGGMTWNSNPVPFGRAYLQFLDPNTGRALADRGAATGSEAVELYQTSDGGSSWISVFHDDPGQPGASDSLPVAGIKNGMTFSNTQTGWVTGSIPSDGEVYLYITRDGGISWSQQNLSLPPGYAIYQYLPQAPDFFGEDGILPVTIYQSGSTGMTFYTSQDGGLTWTGNPANAKRVIQPCLPAIADTFHIWCWDGGQTLYYTVNGAQIWDDMKSTPDLSGRLSQMEFVIGPLGFSTGWALTQVDENGHSQLYRTTNGFNWKPLIP